MPETEPLALSIIHADGRVSRWGPDEPAGKDVPNDLTFGDSVPGGYTTLGTNLFRRIDIQQADEAVFDGVRAYGAGGRTAWDGYFQQFPRTHGDGFGVNPGAVGYSSVLMWGTGFREIYADRGPSHWTEAPLERRAAMSAAAQSMGKIPLTVGGGGISWAPPIESLPDEETTEVHYDAGPGLTVATFGYQGNRTGGAFSGFEAPALFSATAATMAGASSVTLTFDNTTRTATPGSIARYLMMRARVAAGPVTPGGAYLQSLSKVAVYGSHGLTLHAITGEPAGVLGSDVAADIVSRAAPQLTYTTGAGGSIETTSFVVPHAVYREPITAEEGISDINKYYLYDWGVYDNREFFFRQPDPYRLLWEARLSDGAHLDADGDTGEQIINGVYVIYTDATGVQKTVGPPGGSFDDTDTVLEDTSSTNPLNAHGLGRKWIPLTLSFPTTLEGATEIGLVYLFERSLAGRRGTVTLTGTVTHPTEGKVPTWRPRSGDWITLKDLNGAEVPRKIINKTYSHGNRSVQLQLDNTVARLDAIMARVGVMAGIQTGGGF